MADEAPTISPLKGALLNGIGVQLIIAILIKELSTRYPGLPQGISAEFERNIPSIVGNEPLKGEAEEMLRKMRDAILSFAQLNENESEA